LIETFHGSDYFRSVPILCDRYERASILSTDSFLVSAGEALEQVAETQWRHVRLAGRARREGSRSEFRGFRNFEPRTSNRAFLAYRALLAPRSVAQANCFGILLRLRYRDHQREVA
jgi:hypothetical protein